MLKSAKPIANLNCNNASLTAISSKLETNTLNKIIANFNPRCFKSWHVTPEEQRVKFINLAQRIYEHPDFQKKYLTANDEQHRTLEFEKLVKDIIVEDR